MPRFLAPAGAPVPWSRVLEAVLRDGGSEDGLQAFAARFNVRYVWGMSSGRAALCTVLKAMHRLRPQRDIVAVPAYTCFSVPAAIARAGLKVLPVEIDPETLDFDFTRLEVVPGERLLAILDSNLFGYANDAERIARVAKTAGAFFIDDAAQALGATRDSQFAGTRGDAGLYSLGRGKALPVAHGGILVSNSGEIAEALRLELEAVDGAGPLRSARIVLEVLATSALLMPRLYWIPNAIPFLKLGITEFDPGFEIAGLSQTSRALAGSLLEGLADLNATRVRNATMIAEAMGRNSAFCPIEPAPGSRPIYLRLPLLAEDGRRRDMAWKKLRDARIGASGAYPTAICDIPGLQPSLAEGWTHCARAESAAARLLTLPTHAFVQESDISRMVEILDEYGTQCLKSCAGY
jgi:perosamine synthetase